MGLYMTEPELCHIDRVFVFLFFFLRKVKQKRKAQIFPVVSAYSVHKLQQSDKHSAQFLSLERKFHKLV